MRDHLANERTLLAWIRTSLTVVGLGLLAGRLLATGEAPGGWAVAIGSFLVVVGGGTAVAGLWRYLAVERAIRQGAYAPHSLVHVAATALVVVAALLLLAYLLLVPPGGQVVAP